MLRYSRVWVVMNRSIKREAKEKRYISIGIFCILIVCLFSTSHVKVIYAFDDVGGIFRSATSSAEVRILSGADVAVYNDSIAPADYSGVWQDGVIAIKHMLIGIGLTFEEINYIDLNYSTQDFSSLYKIILIPGGYAYWYNYWISQYGKARIRNFVENGGGYLVPERKPPCFEICAVRLPYFFLQT